MRKPRPRKIKQLAEFAQLISSGAQTTTYQEEPSKRKIRGPHSYLQHVKNCHEEGRETSVAPGGGTRGSLEFFVLLFFVLAAFSLRHTYSFIMKKLFKRKGSKGPLAPSADYWILQRSSQDPLQVARLEVPHGNLEAGKSE